jgi:hypothetical protein
VVDVDDRGRPGRGARGCRAARPPECLRAADADRPEQLAVGDEGEAVRAADEPAVEAALDQRDRARAAGLPHPLDDRDRVAGLAQDVGQARRLVRGEDDPASSAARLDGLDKSTGTTGGRTGSRHPNGSPDDSAPRAIAASSGGTDSQVSSRVREPTRRLFQSRGGR